MSEWISVEERLPQVAEGDHEELIVCVRRGHNGKVYVFAARYLNKYPLYSEYHEDADEDGMLISTGWYDVKQHCEYDDWYSELIEPRSGDVITHWMPLPPPPSTPC